MLKEQLINNAKIIREIFGVLNYSEQQCDEHLMELEKIIYLSVLEKLMDGKNLKELKNKINQENIKKFIENNYNKDETAKIFELESKKIILDYFNEVLKGIDAKKAEKIEELLKNWK